MPDAGLQINGKHYSIPTSLRVGETRTIKRITGLNPPEFMVAVGELNVTQDPDVGAAMVWWIMHREDPTITIESIDEIEWGQIEGEDGEEPAVVDPKALAAPSGNSPTSAEGSSVTSELDAGDSMHANGGAPDSDLYAHPT